MSGRRIESGQPSRRFVATIGFRIRLSRQCRKCDQRFVDAKGRRFDYFGSDDPALEGSFDLAGLEISNGSNAQYQLSVEGLDANWSEGAVRMHPRRLRPPDRYSDRDYRSGGLDVVQDVLMQSNALARADWASGSSFGSPVDIPLGGGWGAWMSGYGVADWLQVYGAGGIERLHCR